MAESRLHLIPDKTRPSNILPFPAPPSAHIATNWSGSCEVAAVPIPAFLSYIAVERRLSQNTIDSYAHDLAQFERLLPTGLLTATRDDLRRVFGELQSSGLKAKSMARKISVLRHFYMWARRKRLVFRIPLANIPLPKLPYRVVKPITDAEFGKLLAAIDTRTPEGLRNMAIVRLLDACGLRASELCGLTFADLHLGERYVTVLRTKFDKDRDVPMDAIAADALGEYLERGRPYLYSKIGPEVRTAGGIRVCEEAESGH